MLFIVKLTLLSYINTRNSTDRIQWVTCRMATRETSQMRQTQPKNMSQSAIKHRDTIQDHQFHNNLIHSVITQAVTILLTQIEETLRKIIVPSM